MTDAPDIHNSILAACAGTARAPPLLTLQKGKWFPIRAQINVIMTVPPAGGKTTGTDDDIKNIVPCGDISVPGLLGTVAKNGAFVQGAASLAAGKVLWLDEYQGASKMLFKKLLNLLETGKAQRSLGFPLTANIHKKSGLYGAVKGTKGTGHFEVVSRFSCLMTGTVKPSIQQRDYMQMGGGGMKAWMDAVMLLERFMHVDVRLERKDFYGVISGERIFDIKDYSQYYTEQQKMSDYMDLVKWHKELVESEPFRFLSVLPDEAQGFLTRNCQDIARIVAFGRALEAKKGRERVLGSGGFQARGKLEHYVWQALYSVVVGSLTFSEYKVFMNMRSKNRLTQEEIASDLGISQPAVSKMEERLIKCKLLESSKNV